MALDGLLQRAVPLEWWDNRPGVGGVVLAGLAGLAYVGTPFVAEAVGGDLLALFDLAPLLGVAWLALLWGYVALRVELPPMGWAKLHHALCVAYALPVLAVAAVVAVGVVGLLVIGVLWKSSRG